MREREMSLDCWVFGPCNWGGGSTIAEMRENE